MQQFLQQFQQKSQAVARFATVFLLWFFGTVAWWACSVLAPRQRYATTSTHVFFCCTKQPHFFPLHPVVCTNFWHYVAFVHLIFLHFYCRTLPTSFSLCKCKFNSEFGHHVAFARHQICHFFVIPNSHNFFGLPTPNLQVQGDQTAIFPICFASFSQALGLVVFYLTKSLVKVIKTFDNTERVLYNVAVAHGKQFLILLYMCEFCAHVVKYGIL
ncbi:MAG: hypothetical protein IKC52_04290 [Clostridia bacterium]|nr:hypothetical protein [Clostridia bacterium]